MFVNATKIYPKQKTQKKKNYSLCLGNVSKDFTIKNMKKKPRLKGAAKFFLVDFNPIDNYDIINIHKCFMERA